MQITRPRKCEAYEVRCLCGAEYETPALTVDTSGVIVCPNCWRTSKAEWREGRI